MFRKALFRALLAASLIVPATIGAGSAAEAASPTLKVTLDGKTVSLDNAPRIVKGTTLVPYAGLVHALGGTASWDGKTQTVTATNNGTTVKVAIGSKTAYINGAAKSLDASPLLVDDRAYVPLRLVSEAFGKWVSYDKPSATVSITSERTVTASTGPLKLKAKPRRIVTLSSSDTEIVYALGGSVVGRPTALGAVQPPEAAAVPEVGSTHGILFEKLATLKPDLVIAPPSLRAQQATLEKLGAQVLFNSHNTFSDIQASIRLYGSVLGQEAKAEQLVIAMNASVADLKKPATAPKTLIVYGAPGSFVVALPTSYPGNFLELAGGKNVASGFPKMDSMPQYAELSLERIIAANPELILFIAHGDADEVKAGFKKEFESNAAWKNLSAVKNDRFEVLPTELFAANPGLRAPQAIAALNKLLLQVK